MFSWLVCRMILFMYTCTCHLYKTLLSGGYMISHGNNKTPKIILRNQQRAAPIIWIMEYLNVTLEKAVIQSSFNGDLLLLKLLFVFLSSINNINISLSLGAGYWLTQSCKLLVYCKLISFSIPWEFPIKKQEIFFVILIWHNSWKWDNRKMKMR